MMYSVCYYVLFRNIQVWKIMWRMSINLLVLLGIADKLLQPYTTLVQFHCDA